MHCPLEHENGSILLLDYCAGRLERDEADRIRRHIEECEGCRELVREATMWPNVAGTKPSRPPTQQADSRGEDAIWRILDEWEPAPISADFDRKLFARIQAEHEGGTWNHIASTLRDLFLRPAFPVALACLSVLATVLLLPPRDVTTATQIRADSVDIEQVEKVLDDMDMLNQLAPSPQPEASGQQSL